MFGGVGYPLPKLWFEGKTLSVSSIFVWVVVSYCSGGDILGPFGGGARILGGGGPRALITGKLGLISETIS